MKRVAFAVLIFGACSSGPEIPKAGPATDQAQTQPLLDKADAKYAAMTTKDDIKPALDAYEDVLKSAPANRRALEQVGLLSYYYANKVVPESDKDKRMAGYLRGREAGLRAMALNQKFREAYEKDQDIAKQMPLMGKEDVTAMYWAAVNWAKWGELYGIIRAAIDIPKVRAMMNRANELDAPYWGNAADRFFAGYWVAIPGFAGRDAKKSKAAFDKAVATSPDFLDNYVIFASYYCKDQEDKKQFEAVLNKVIATPADTTMYKFFNDLARTDAKDLLAHEKEIFD
jgi:hypothetical protein